MKHTALFLALAGLLAPASSITVDIDSPGM